MVTYVANLENIVVTLIMAKIMKVRIYFSCFFLAKTNLATKNLA